jgi:hypothetical protein
MVVTDWHDPAHPQALLLRGSDLVADALSCDFPFKLSE